MRNSFIVSLIVFILLAFSYKTVGAQMMGSYQNQTSPSQSELQDEQNMQKAGQQIWDALQSGKTSCKKLTNDDFEKLGEYFMGQVAGSVENHVYWDRNIQQMMGDQGDSQMHIAWGERGSGCFANAVIPSNTPSFFQGMMGNLNNGNNSQSDKNGGESNMMWGYGQNLMGGFGILGFLLYLVVLVDLILLGFYIWKKLK